MWLDSFSENATISAVTASALNNNYATYTPPDPDTLNGTSAQLEYNIMLFAHHYLKATIIPGMFYDLVMWDDMPLAARSALETTDFNAEVPLIDDALPRTLRKLTRGRPTSKHAGGSGRLILKQFRTCSLVHVHVLQVVVSVDSYMYDDFTASRIPYMYHIP